MNFNFYWLPFPGMYQCVITNDDGATVAEGMGATKDAAKEAAER